jgi:hypothetical protein
VVEFLNSIGIRDPEWVTAIEVSTYIAAWFFCLYWMRALFLARDGVRHFLRNLLVTAAALYLVIVGFWVLSRPIDNSMTSHIMFAVGVIFLLFGIVYLRRAPKPRKRSIPKRIRASVIARDLGDEPFDSTKHHIDHIWPFSKGGSHKPENLRVIDKTKNLKTGARPSKFREMWH